MTLRESFVLPGILWLWSVSVGFGDPDASLRVSFYPEVLRVYEVDPTRSINGALLQNAAVINDSGEAINLREVEIELVSGGEAVQAHRLTRAELERAVKKGAALEKSGLLQKYSFQFRPERLLGKDTRLSTDLTLPSHSAILLGQRYFVFPWVPDSLRVRVSGTRASGGETVTAQGNLRISRGQSGIEYLFPVAGRSYIGTGQGLHQPHRWVVAEEFALDIVRLGEGGSSHRGEGSKRADFYAYGAPVLAAADGKVRAVQGQIQERDSSLRQPGETAEAYLPRLMAAQEALLNENPVLAAGNYIVLEHGNGEYSLYAHLIPGSLQVKAGEAVKAGQVIGKLGHSGNSSEPHLHFQVMDGPDPLMSAGLPVRFKNVRLPFADRPRSIQSGDVVETSDSRD
jgi:murein DD-endopeptidase MepM/ murein hydrolase activator NlpD